LKINIIYKTFLFDILIKIVYLLSIEATPPKEVILMGDKDDDQDQVKMPLWMERWHGSSEEFNAALGRKQAEADAEAEAAQLDEAEMAYLQGALHQFVIDDNVHAAGEIIATGVVPLQKTLAFAVESGYPVWTQTLLNAGAKATSPLLHHAATNGHPQCAEALVAAGAASYNKTRQFVQKDGLEKMKSIVGGAGCASVDEEMEEAARNPMTAEDLHQAVLNDEVPRAEEMIATGIVPLEKTLAFAVESGFPVWTQRLLDADAKPNSDMLHHAATNKHPKCARALVNAGAKCYKKTRYYVAEHGSKQMKEALAFAEDAPPPRKNTSFDI
jgi:hypothetical protein